MYKKKKHSWKISRYLQNPIFTWEDIFYKLADKKLCSSMNLITTVRPFEVPHIHSI